MTATKEEMEKRVQEEATKRAQEALTASLGIQNTLEKCQRIRAEWLVLRGFSGTIDEAQKSECFKRNGDTLRGLKDLKKLQEQYEQDLSRISQILISKKSDPKLQDLQKIVSPTTLADLQKISTYAEAFPVAVAASASVSAPGLAPAPAAPIGTPSMLAALFPIEQAAAAPVAPASAVPATLFPSSAPAALLPSSSLLAASAPSPLVAMPLVSSSPLASASAVPATLFPSSAPAALLPSSSLLASAPSPLVSGSAFAIMQASHEQNKKQEAKLTAEIAALTEQLGKLKAEIEAQEKELPKLQAEQKAKEEKEEKEAKAAKEAQDKASFLQQFQQFAALQQQLIEQAKRLGIDPSALASAAPAAASAPVPAKP